MAVVIRLCAQDDLPALRDLSRRTFRETFAGANAPADIEAYLDRAYHPEKLRAQWRDAHSQFYLLYHDGALAGYMKLNEAPAQTELRDEASLEIERIYLLRAFQGLGLGARLLEKAIAQARAQKKQYLWLGVWEKNARAIAFYRRHGFYRIGAHAFWVGEDKQTDELMRLDL